MKRRIFLCLVAVCLLIVPVGAEPIRWVDFNVGYEAMEYALGQDIATAEYIQKNTPEVHT